MNVASLELCKELYEVSGWKNPKAGVFEIEKAWRPTPLMSGDNYRLINIGPNTPEDIPAYDAGFLLRKLPRDVGEGENLRFLSLEPQAVSREQWSARYSDENYKNPLYSRFADTPEDALCQLAIELFKKGILLK